MTADERWNKWKRQFHRPQFIVLTAAIAGFLILVASGAYGIMPAFKQKLGSAHELLSLKQQMAELDKTPVPEPYDPQTAAPWLKKVPVGEDHSALIKTLLNLETRSGSNIVQITFQEEKPEADELTQLMQNLKKPAASQPNGETAETEKPEVTEQGFLVQPLFVKAEGTYAQIREFWTGLHRLERLAIMEQWNVTTHADGRVEFSATLSIFTAPDFSNILPEPESFAHSAIFGNPENPALSDERFMDMLQSAKN